MIFGGASMDADMLSRAEAFLKKPVFVIDLLPERVPEGSRGQFFAIEDHWYGSKTGKKLSGRFFRILLRLNCYYDLEVCRENGSVTNPEPEKLEEMVKSCREKKLETLRIFVNEGESMLILNGDDLNMTVYGPDQRLQRILWQLSVSEGLFFWEAE